jgi:hypothetical protein
LSFNDVTAAARGLHRAVLWVNISFHNDSWLVDVAERKYMR